MRVNITGYLSVVTFTYCFVLYVYANTHIKVM